MARAYLDTHKGRVVNGRKAIRATQAGLPGDSEEVRGEVRRRTFHTNTIAKVGRRVLPIFLTGLLFLLVIWVGSGIAIAIGRSGVQGVATLSAKRIPHGVPTIMLTWTPSPSPTPKPTKTLIPEVVPPVPSWFTERTMVRYAGIVSGETWSLTDTQTLNFLATQIMYDAIKYKGNIPADRWKAYGRPTHETLQAVNVALMNYDKPLWPRCAFVGGYNDGDYFARVSKYKQPDYTFGSGEHVVEGWGCH